MKNRSLKLFCCVALFVALTLICVLFLHYHNLGIQLRTIQSQLAESRNTWETTAAKKEALQEDKKALENELKEAKLSLKEAQEKAASLKEDIKTLNKEIEELKSKLRQQ